MHPLSMKFLCHFKMELLVGGYTLNLVLEHAAQSKHCLFYEIPARTSRVAVKWSAILRFNAVWRRAGKLKIS
jgi:hypothetical protein